MSDVTMIGLGAMGSALASAFLGAGHGVTVWNRTAAKMAPLVVLGAKAAESVAKAVEASPIVVVCIDNYAATRRLLDARGVLKALAGRTFIQLSTGTPREVRNCKAWMDYAGAAYIDGAIMPYPSGIGGETAQILFAGPDAAYRRAEPLLRCLGGDLRYLGDNVTAAAVLDMALLTHELCSDIGILHGANLCQAEDVGVDLLASMFADGHPAKKLASLIHAGSGGGLGATISVWNAALQRIRTQTSDAGINSEVPDFIAGLFDRAIAAGHGDEDLVALIKLLRAGRPR